MEPSWLIGVYPLGWGAGWAVSRKRGWSWAWAWEKLNQNRIAFTASATRSKCWSAQLDHLLNAGGARLGMAKICKLPKGVRHRSSACVGSRSRFSQSMDASFIAEPLPWTISTFGLIAVSRYRKISSPRFSPPRMLPETQISTHRCRIAYYVRLQNVVDALRRQYFNKSIRIFACWWGLPCSHLIVYFATGLAVSIEKSIQVSVMRSQACAVVSIPLVFSRQ